MEDASFADPERNVVGFLGRAVNDQVAGAEVGLGQPLACLFLLVGVSRHEAPAGPERHVDEAGAIDPGGGHPAPLVVRTQQRPRLVEWVGGDGPQPVGSGLAPEVGAPRPARISVGGLHPGPLAMFFEHPQRLSGQGLRHLLHFLRRLRAERRELAGERMFA